MRTSAISRAIVCWAVLCVCSERAASAKAADLGRIGPVWPIAEPDLLVSMQHKAAARLADGGSARLETELRERSERYVSAPPALGLPRATTDRSWTLDPSVTLPDDLLDADGKLLIRAGTRVNPLDVRPLSRVLVFVDTGDPAQLRWLERTLSSARPAKLILTGGSPSDTAKHLEGRTVYFDQNGELVRALGIHEVPTTVEQEDRHLRLRSFDPEEAP